MLNLLLKLLMFTSAIMTYIVCAIFIANLNSESMSYSFAEAVFHMLLCASLLVSGGVTLKKGVDYGCDY